MAAAAQYLGNTPAVLLATYAHLIPDDDTRAREAMEAAFAGVLEDADRAAESQAADC